jgi:hypothetical protein
MQIKTNARHFTAFFILSLSILATSCSKQPIQELAAENADPIIPPDIKAVNAINSTWTVNWDGLPNGSTYTTRQASAAFGNVNGWNQSRAMISNDDLRITLLKNSLSGAGGVVANIDISDGTAYELDFDVRFHSAFDWSRGGKIGFGFAIGEGNAGGDPAWDGNGGTLRMMWYQNDAGRVYFQPYVYYRDQPGQFGNDFGRTYPVSGSLNRGQTYHVHMYIKSNTGSNTNGRAQILVDGYALLDVPIRWTTNDAQRLIRNLTFHTFRGGSQTYWQSATDGYIYYDNLSVHKIS